MKIGRPRTDLSGQRFGKLTVISYHSSVIGAVYYLCVCDCGRIHKAIAANLKRGNTKRCAFCSGKGKVPVRNRTHGLRQTPEYVAWLNAKSRCYNPRVTHFDSYGGRGIKVCDRWLDSFENFYRDMGPRPSRKHSLDRIDVHGNYSPRNCRWATPQEQRDNYQNSVVVEFRGQKIHLRLVAEAHGRDYRKVYQRYHKGWSVERAIATP
jgi:hypothetical protein